MARPAALAARNASERKVEKWHTCCLLFPLQPRPCRFCVLLPACLLPRARRTRALLRSTTPAKLVVLAQSTVEARRKLHRERMKTCWKKRLHRKQFIRRKAETHRKRFTLRKLEERKRGCKAEKCLRMGLRPRVSNCVGECPSVFPKGGSPFGLQRSYAAASSFSGCSSPTSWTGSCSRSSSRPAASFPRTMPPPKAMGEDPPTPTGSFGT